MKKHTLYKIISYTLLPVGALIAVFDVAAALARPDLLSQALDQVMAMQTATAPISKEQLLKTVKVMMYFFGAFSVLLIIHAFITFRLLKQYSWLFGNSANDPQ